MSPSASEFLPSLLAIAALAMAMVFVMVRWSRAMLERPLGEEAPASPVSGWPPAWRWGLAYLAVWALLIAAFLRFFDRVGAASAGRNLPFMLLVAAGWLGLNGLLIAFARALQRANRRAASRVEPPDAQEEMMEEEIAASVAAAAPSGEPAPAAAPAPRSRLRGLLGRVTTLVLLLLAIGIGEALPPLQRLHAWTLAHQARLLWITIPLGAVGFALFMGGIVAMVLGRGKPMSRREIDELSARNRALAAGPALWRRSAYRSSGWAVGAQAEDSASFAEIKAAFRARAWRVSPRWRRMFLILLGAALLVCGLFGSLFVLASAGIKLVIGGALLYAVVRSAVAFARA